MNSNPPSCTFLDADKTKEMLQLWKGEKKGWVQVGEKKWLFPSRYLEFESIYNFKTRSTDTWLLSFPRSGTHWTGEMVWQLSNNLDFNTAKKQLLEDRFRLFGSHIFLDPEITKTLPEHNKEDATVIEFVKRSARPDYVDLEALESPRFIYSHFPPCLLPNVMNSGCKIVYVARNPKDVAVSWYLFNKSYIQLGFIGDFPTFWNYFKNDLTICSPYWEHLKDAWAQKDNPNFLFIFYEEMKADLFSAVKKVSKFLGKNYTDGEISKLTDFLDIEEFKNNPMVNGEKMRQCGYFTTSGVYVRDGKSRNWKSTFTDELEKEADEWVAENLKDTDLVFPMEKLIN